MSNGKVLRYTDPRRFGAVVDQNAGRPSGTGSSWPGAAQRRVQRRLSPAKMREEENRDQTRLMDNKLVVGVGNIYASESLFSAGIHPDRLASRCRGKSVSSW